MNIGMAVLAYLFAFIAGAISVSNTPYHWVGFICAFIGGALAGVLAARAEEAMEASDDY